jgi:phospholipid/cholesterol/gamma-HCH transport system ATP-binding protein
MENKISISNLSISFGNNKVIKNFSLKIKNGQKLGIIGGSGSGKSVLIKSMIGLVDKKSGSILINNEEITHNVEKNVKKHNIGMTFQNDGLFDSMNILENLCFPLIQKNIANKADSKNIAKAIIKKIHLDENVLNKYPSELSGGMRKRIAVARVIITKPSIIFFDEPTTGLDPITSQSIINIISDYIKSDDVTSIVVTHSIRCVKQLSDHVLIIKDGKLLLHTEAQELQNSSDEYVEKFLKYS